MVYSITFCLSYDIWLLLSHWEHILNLNSISRLQHFGFNSFLFFCSHGGVACENFTVVKGSANEDNFHRL